MLGEKEIAADRLFGIHTVRALENFPFTSFRLHSELVRAFGAVKLAAAATNRELGIWDRELLGKGAAIEAACREMAEGKLDEAVRVSPLQGGAGTSLNMNVNEVLANRALELLGKKPGDDAAVSPLGDINRHQSTNDTYPTALRLAAIRLGRKLEAGLLALQESFQAAEKKFAHIVKIGRTEMQDAVLTTAGREMAAYAEAVGRDRWRVYKCEERLRVVNLGGTAIGTGLGAPRDYIFRVTEKLKEITGIGFARAEDLVEATQNTDALAEVSGILKACAVSQHKIAGDLRFLSSGPEAGIAEVRLPIRQAGSSIMPEKTNPVIPEAVMQSAMLVMGLDQTLAMACASGHLELNPFLPLTAFCLLESLELLATSAHILKVFCVDGLEFDEARCRRQVENSTAVATALLPALGYEKTAAVAGRAKREGQSVRQIVLEEKLMNEKEFDAWIRPEAVCRLGSERKIKN